MTNIVKLLRQENIFSIYNRNNLNFICKIKIIEIPKEELSAEGAKLIRRNK